jgi:hypothetical protein
VPLSQSTDDGSQRSNAVINNACATLAILNAVFNFPQSDEGECQQKVELGSELENLKEFGQGMDSAVGLSFDSCVRGGCVVRG